MAADRQEIGKREEVGQQNRRSLLNHKDISTGAHFAHTRRAASSVNSLILLAPQVGFEPTTLRLTAERLIAASRCKHKYLHAQKADYRVNWGGIWGDSSPPRLQHLRQGSVIGWHNSNSTRRKHRRGRTSSTTPKHRLRCSPQQLLLYRFRRGWHADRNSRNWLSTTLNKKKFLCWGCLLAVPV